MVSNDHVQEHKEEAQATFECKPTVIRHYHRRAYIESCRGEGMGRIEVLAFLVLWGLGPIGVCKRVGPSQRSMACQKDREILTGP